MNSILLILYVILGIILVILGFFVGSMTGWETIAYGTTCFMYVGTVEVVFDKLKG